MVFKISLSNIKGTAGLNSIIVDQSSAKTVSFKIDAAERVNVFKWWRRKLAVLVFLRFLNPSKFQKLWRKKKDWKNSNKEASAAAAAIPFKSLSLMEQGRVCVRACVRVNV